MLFRLDSFILANTLLFAAIMKVANRAKLFEQMAKSFKFSRRYLYMITAIEGFCGIGLLFEIPYFEYVCLSMMSAFLVIVIWMSKRAPANSCQCFGAFSAEKTGKEEIARNLLLLCLSVVLLFGYRDTSVIFVEAIALFCISLAVLALLIMVPQLVLCVRFTRRFRL